MLIHSFALCQNTATRIISHLLQFVPCSLNCNVHHAKVSLHCNLICSRCAAKNIRARDSSALVVVMRGSVPDVASGEGLVHEAQGICTGGTWHFQEALHKEAPVLVMPHCQWGLLAASCQIRHLLINHI